MTTQPFDRNLQAHQLNELGYDLVNNSQEEILAAVKEFVERKVTEPTPRQLWAKSKLKPFNYCYGGSGHFSNAILQLYDDQIT